MMPSDEPRQVGTLQVEHDLREQERIWKVQRWARIALLLFLLGGLVGAFGGSWLGWADDRDPTGRLRVGHPRLARQQAPYKLRFEVSGELAAGNELSVWVDTKLLRGLRIDAIQTAPASEELAVDRIVYRFQIAERARVIPLTFHATTESFGAARGQVGVVGGPELTLSHFVHP